MQVEMVKYMVNFEKANSSQGKQGRPVLLVSVEVSGMYLFQVLAQTLQELCLWDERQHLG